jgi:soluble lytic murein transglycosylase-like protein
MASIDRRGSIAMPPLIVAMACGLAAQSPVLAPLDGQPACTTAASMTESGAADHRIAAWTAEIAQAASRFALPPSWLRAVMRIESGGDPSAISAQGAIGLMQIMPATWQDLRRRYGLGDDPYAPADNVLAGAAYAREMLDRYGAPLFLAAYNAGPDRVDDYLLRGRPLPAETRHYVATVAPQLAVAVSTHADSRASDAQPNGFSAVRPAADEMFAAVPSPGLFVSLHDLGDGP